MGTFTWEQEFLNSVATFEKAGLSAREAERLLKEYIAISHKLSIPKILEFSDLHELKASPYLARDEKIHDLMISILGPLLSQFELQGKENFLKIIPYLKKTGVTIVSNHLSHFDAAVIYALLQREADIRDIAGEIFFLAGRFVYLSSFSNVAARMFHASLVASPRDISENIAIKRDLAKLNLRSFKETKVRQQNGQILVLYPEGTRSRSGEMARFHAGVMNYLQQTVVLPVSLVGPEEILQSESFTFGLTSGRMHIQEPIFVGSRKKTIAELASLHLEDFPQETRKQQVMDELGKCVALSLPKKMQGVYG
ncbi:MAG: lysophospholipid acyltransferase family protein [Spirochaetota bacterium]